MEEGWFKERGINFSQWNFALLHLSPALAVVPPYVTCREPDREASSSPDLAHNKVVLRGRTLRLEK